MKILYWTLGLVIIIGLVTSLILLITNKKIGEESPDFTEFPQLSDDELGQQQQGDPLDTLVAQPEVAKALFSQINNPDQITLEETTISSNYALQVWGDENMGGEALMQYDPQTGWTLISMGGGAWSVSGLVSVGVPNDIAEQLMKDRE